MPINQFTKTINSTFELMDKGREKHTLSFAPLEVGSVVRVSADIVKVSGYGSTNYRKVWK